MKFNLRICLYTALSVFSFFVLSCDQRKDYNPNTYLNPHQKDAIITTIVRYAAPRPDNVPDADKFNPRYDSFYLGKASRIRFEQYFAKGDDFYFLISQPAPSLIEKRHATGGRFRLSDKGEMTEYEEIFRTWKMVPDTLKIRSYLLFDKMMRLESLEPYYTRNSKGVDYIEFPNDRVYYDVGERKWKVK